MEHLGAADYFFWRGVEMALTSDISDVDSHATTMFKMDNDVTRTCQDAFKWGFALGLNLTRADYVDLTVPKVPVKLKTDEKVEVELTNTPLSGNC